MANNGGAPPQLVGQALELFKEGLSMTLSRWSALQMAVEMEWGGRDSRRKAEELESDILSWFTQSRGKEPLYIDDLECFLEEAMITLCTGVEDGSITEVAEKLMIMHGECSEGNFQSIEKLRAAAPRRVAYVKQAVNGEEDDSDSDSDSDSGGDDDMMVDVPETKPKSQSGSAGADDDGWMSNLVLTTELIRNVKSVSKAEVIPTASNNCKIIYDAGEHLVLVTTDRQSAFDTILASISFKGQNRNNRRDNCKSFPTIPKIFENLLGVPEVVVSKITVLPEAPEELVCELAWR
ncbi:hypothetical protein ACFE04_023807 [Oxalis oulophora]